ncbi:winged helix-turn-helix domain-containing protein [Microbulbifer agarilyticus]|uniref:winged helix-turn-helix domain-containing protein n=1 Tax=Microbulbifer agarilyticus TaxID=260552 RepID=UPI001CD54DE3|nr:winged helix-turn-helix domain-containing protein [Microbulbifer agarilyticus]MCA0901479.1 tetratricopeptide repeat protein [Microbulbifer agarilyticus]
MATLQFGEFTLDSPSLTLSRRGRTVVVQELPLKLLVLLASRPGELFDRDELFRHFWPDDQSGLLDDNLNTLVRKLRRALNDSPRNPRFIETQPRKGYRFIAPVAVVGSTSNVDACAIAPQQSVSHIPWRRRHAAGIAATLVIALALIVGPYLTGPEVPSQQPFHSVAVLPFINVGDDNQRDYFSDGLADELINRLASFPDLRVVARTSSFSIQGSALDARAIGKRLETDVLVEGSVHRRDDKLRIHVRLVDTRSGYQLWAQSFQRDSTDIFALQEEVALNVVASLAGKLLPEGIGRSRAEINPAAYDSYLKGRFYWHKRSEVDLRRAVVHFEAAIGQAPDYAPAWAGLADTFAVLGFYDFLPPEEAFGRAKGAARRALQLDPANDSAEATLGYVALYFDWDFEEAEARFLQSIAINPAYAKAHQWYANLLVAAGRFDKAEREMRYATQLDPLSLIANAALGWVLYHAGDHEGALRQLETARELDPEFQLVDLWRGWTLEAMGDYDGAITALERNVEKSSGNTISVASLARVLALAGREEEASTLLQGLLASDGYVPAYEVAKAHLAAGNSDAAVRWLERAYEQRSHSMVFLRVDPQLANLRKTASYQQILAQVFKRG